MSTTHSVSAFDEIVARFEESIPCVWQLTRSGRPCRNPAKWSVNFHGCRRGTICTRHYNIWTQGLMGLPKIVCSICHQGFPNLAAAQHVVPL